MSNKVDRKTGFLVQGTILAIASIVSRIIGLVYRIPMTNIIGDAGNGYYNTAFEVYNIMLLISSYSLPIAVSKFISECKSKGNYRLIHKVFRTAMILSVTSGLAAATLIFIGAPYITTALKSPLAIYALLVLAPALIILSVLGVLRGLFQGMGTMMPTAFSQIIEQVVNAVISVVMAYQLYQRGLKVGGVLGNTKEYSAALGAAGGTMGTTLGAFAGFLFIFFIFAIYRPSLVSLEKRQVARRTESYAYLAKVLILTIVPVLLSTTIYNVSGIIDQFIFKNIAAVQNYDPARINIWWGVYTGKYKVLVNVPLAIASAMAASIVPSLTGAFAQKDYALARRKTYMATRFVMVIALPCVVGIGVLASPIMQLLFKDSSALAAHLLWAGCISVAFYSLSTLSNGILQGINRLIEPVKNAVVALVLHVILLVVLMFVFKLNIYAVLYANTFYAFVMCILNARSIRKYLKYRQEIVKTFIIPSIASILMGAFAFGTYKGFMMIYPSNTIATLLAILVGVISYGVLILVLKGLSEEELTMFPKGYLIIKVAKKLHLLR